MSASPELQWLLLKKQNKFAVKQNGNSSRSVVFSCEPNNLRNWNTFKHSGLIHPKTVGIEAGPEGLQIVLSKKTKRGNRPNKSINRTLLKKEFGRMAKVVVNQVETSHYRPDLTGDALARLSAVHKSLKFAQSGGKRKRKTGKVAIKE